LIAADAGRTDRTSMAAQPMTTAVMRLRGVTVRR
jgi:hypothetical protein